MKLAISPDCKSQLETAVKSLPICQQDADCEFHLYLTDNNVPQIYCLKRRFVRDINAIMHEDLGYELNSSDELGR